MEYCKKRFNTEEETEKFVKAAELEFEKRLDNAVMQACSIDNLRVIGLSGPTCSGKTTTAKKLLSEFSAQSRRIRTVSIDNFFKNVDKNKSADEIDFDSIDALDFDEFKECVDEIFAGKTVKIPEFDFVTGKRSGYTEFDPDEKDLYVFEGIQAVYPEISALLRKVSSHSIFICVEQSINVGGTVFEPEEIRLMRRIVRDRNFRGATPEYTMFLWESVRRNEIKNILPYADGCDIRIDSTMPYEINLLTQFIRPLLRSVPSDNKYKAQADAMYEKLEGIEPISQKYIPDESLYYEFIKRI